MFNLIFRLLVSIFAALLIMVGVVLAPSPVPLGLIFIALGFLLLTASAPAFVRWLRGRWRWLDQRLIDMEKVLPDWLARQLRKSHPKTEDEEEAERNAASLKVYRDEKAGDALRGQPFV